MEKQWGSAVAAVLMLLWPLNASASHGAGQCGPREEVLAQIKKNFSEIPGARGLTFRGDMLEVLVAPSGSWTIIVQGPGEESCVLTSGEGWENVPPPPARDGST